ncbi:thioredoxin-disulfide reductase [Aureibacillus halotolerans]|uniref:Thioredoxin reductase n=1 Tax=Aureibacillus halotolerans TaxID=1508390 RepID=A0A4R6UCI0_9BACI|nr:thioredoxin-disulfide reductase [Aureibacillus halotolerans]TDQ42729.1 thioredoxin reductase (NADPH) [Aureibacillus halotolerans]
MYKAVILGTGPAGLTAAIYLARANMEPVVIEGPEPGGQLTLTTEVENYPGFEQGILGPELMETMKKQAVRFGARFERGLVTKLKSKSSSFTIVIDSMGDIEAEAVIVSTGASAKLLGIPGETEMIGNGVSTCATCDGFFFRNKRVIIVGGGDSAMEEANFLTKFASEVLVVHRRDELRASKIMQERARNNKKITWAMNRTPIGILTDGQKTIGLEVVNNDSGENENLDADGVFVAIGHRPNTSFLKDLNIVDETGYINVQPGSTHTKIPGLFACGDVQDKTYRQAITAAGTGCMAAMDCEKYLEGERILDWSQNLS